MQSGKTESYVADVKNEYTKALLKQRTAFTGQFCKKLPGKSIRLISWTKKAFLGFEKPLTAVSERKANYSVGRFFRFLLSFTA